MQAVKVFGQVSLAIWSEFNGIFSPLDPFRSCPSFSKLPFGDTTHPAHQPSAYPSIKYLSALHLGVDERSHGRCPSITAFACPVLSRAIAFRRMVRKREFQQAIGMKARHNGIVCILPPVASEIFYIQFNGVISGSAINLGRSYIKLSEQTARGVS